jgi:N-acetylglutamate synthase-like GNAT family acetyltransferase
MVKHEIRPALESESTQIKALINLAGINPTGLDWRRFVVAVNDRGGVIACGQVKPHGRGNEILELASIATHPDHRGQGLARKVIEALLEKTPRPLYLMCMAHNGPMYEKFGFVPITYEQMPRYFQRIRKLFDVANIIRRDEELLVMKLE